MIPNLVFVLRRRWPVLVLLPILTVVAVVVATPGAPKAEVLYTTRVYLAADPSEGTGVSLEQAAVEIKQEPIARAAAAAMGEPTANPKAFAAQLRVKVVANSLTMQLTAQDPSRTRVLAYTTAFAEEFVKATDRELDDVYRRKLVELTDAVNRAEVTLRTFLEKNAAAILAVPPDFAATTQQQLLQQRVAEAQARLTNLSDDLGSPYRIAGSDPVTRVAADKLQLPSSRPVRGLMAFILGIVGALALVAFIEKLNPRIDDPKRAEELIGAPVLAMVPIVKGKRHKDIERADLAQFTGPFAESFRAMRSHLDYRSIADDLEFPPCVMVVSSAPGEGKTTTSAFLALSYAEAGRDVIILGGDFRRPAIHRLFDVPRVPGLSSRLLAEDAGAGVDDLVRDIVKLDERTGVRVVPSGPGTDRVTGLLSDMTAVTNAGRESGCTVIVDTAPVMVANDAVDFLPSVDWVVLVVRLGRSTERSLKATMQSLELNHATVVGCVIIGSLEASDAKRYYYSYYQPDETRTLDPDIQIRAARRQAEAAHAAAAGRTRNANGGAPRRHAPTSPGNDPAPERSDRNGSHGVPVDIGGEAKPQ